MGAKNSVPVRRISRSHRQRTFSDLDNGSFKRNGPNTISSLQEICLQTISDSFDFYDKFCAEYLPGIFVADIARRLSTRRPITIDDIARVRRCIDDIPEISLPNCPEITDTMFERICRPCLIDIDLSGCVQVTDRSLALIVPLPHLRRLNLRGCYQLQCVGFNGLNFSPTLEEIDFGGCTNISCTALNLLEHCVSLNYLVLDDCRRLFPIKSIPVLSSLSLISELSLIRSSIYSPDLMPAVSQLLKLDRARFDWLQLTDDDVSCLSRNVNLKFVSLKGSRFTDVGLSLFLSNPDNIIESIDLSSCKLISDLSLAHLSKCRNIKSIKISRTRIHRLPDEFCINFANTLQRLDVSYTQLSDNSIQLSKLSNMKGLIELRLCGCRISDRTIHYLSINGILKNLKCLTVGETNVSDHGCQMIGQSHVEEQKAEIIVRPRSNSHTPLSSPPSIRKFSNGSNLDDSQSTSHDDDDDSAGLNEYDDEKIRLRRWQDRRLTRTVGSSFDEPLTPVMSSFVCLRNIDVSLCDLITSDGIINLTRSLTSLVELKLDNRAIDDRIMPVLVDTNRNIKYLHLLTCRISDDGLACIPQLRLLEELHVCGGLLTDNCIMSVCQLHNLKILNLSQNLRISDSNIHLLNFNDKLQELNVSLTSATGAGLLLLTCTLDMRIITCHECKGVDKEVSRQLTQALPRLCHLVRGCFDMAGFAREIV